MYGYYNYVEKNKHSLFVINEWYRISSLYFLLKDDDIDTITTNTTTTTINNNNNVSHRHDQSILSLLVKKYGSIKIPDETFFYPFWEKTGLRYPFWATRKRK